VNYVVVIKLLIKRSAVAGVDGEDRVVVVRVKRPKNVHTIILESINPLLDQIAECTGDAATVAGHNRGDFSRVQCGYHHGIGSKVSKFICCYGNMSQTLDRSLIRWL
jgi:hypothetical protein